MVNLTVIVGCVSGRVSRKKLSAVDALYLDVTLQVLFSAIGLKQAMEEELLTLPKLWKQRKQFEMYSKKSWIN